MSPSLGRLLQQQLSALAAVEHVNTLNNMFETHLGLRFRASGGIPTHSKYRTVNTPHRAKAAAESHAMMHQQPILKFTWCKGFWSLPRL